MCTTCSSLSLCCRAKQEASRPATNAMQNMPCTCRSWIGAWNFSRAAILAGSVSWICRAAFWKCCAGQGQLEQFLAILQGCQAMSKHDVLTSPPDRCSTDEDLAPERTLDLALYYIYIYVFIYFI